MKYAIRDAFNSLMRLVRFVVWYVAAIAVLFYLLPILGLFLEERFDMLSNSVKFFSVIGFFAVVAAWQLADRRDRIRASIGNRDTSGTDGFRSA